MTGSVRDPLNGVSLRFRKLGSSDLEVGDLARLVADLRGRVEVEQTGACTEAAFEAGITFDTANVSGRGAAETAWAEMLSTPPTPGWSEPGPVRLTLVAAQSFLGNTAHTNEPRPRLPFPAGRITAGPPGTRRRDARGDKS